MPTILAETPWQLTRRALLRVAPGAIWFQYHG
jgi:hypothetical protein